jgi:hypothetical protein
MERPLSEMMTLFILGIFFAIGIAIGIVIGAYTHILR